MKYTFSEIQRMVAPIADKYQIPQVFLFGSFARGTQSDTSDIDFIVSREGSLIRSAFDMGGLFSDLEEAFGTNIDLITLESLNDNGLRNKSFSEAVSREKKLVYERK